jgi:hypothetical protein
MKPPETRYARSGELKGGKISQQTVVQAWDE